MFQYLKSVLSFKKVLYKNLSPLAYWDRNSSFTKQSEIRRFAKLKNSHIGKYSRINPKCKLANTTIGNFCAIGEGTRIGLGRHPLNYISTHSIFYKPNNLKNSWVKPIDLEIFPIIIGNDVWVGMDSVILDGVKIGDGAVIGARTVVTKDVPPYAIVVGSPAKVIKYRFDAPVIERLLKIKWWHFNDDKITRHIQLFREPHITIDLLNQFFPTKGV
ncbi:MAG: CatB-related O-acetyltransferase [Cyclobacterium sp.]|uniref:CatB-related O-acetyltransferase n=1 Tax=Cyclobacterium sp. TaxID=1966343 RepID=UPI003970FD0D